MPSSPCCCPDLVGRWVAAVTALLTFGLTIPLGLGRQPGMWHELSWPWVPEFGLRFQLGVDGISYPLVVLTGLLTLLCCGYSIWRTPKPGRGNILGALLLLIEVGILGTFLAQNLVLFFIAFEVVLLPMAAVIAVWGGDGARRAALKFALYTLAGSVLLLVGVISVVVLTGTGDMVNPAAALQPRRAAVDFRAFRRGLRGEEPAVAAAHLAARRAHRGAHGRQRHPGRGAAEDGHLRADPGRDRRHAGGFRVGLAGARASWPWRPSSSDRWCAWCRPSSNGSSPTPRWATWVSSCSASPPERQAGLQAALIGNIAHGVLTGLLFFLAGAIKDRAHTGELAELGGLREKAPWLAGILGLAAIGSLGLPGLAGFWGEAFAVLAAYSRGGPLWTTLAIVAAIGGALTAAYLLRLLRKVSHGPLAPSLATAADTRLVEAGLLVAAGPAGAGARRRCRGSWSTWRPGPP